MCLTFLRRTIRIRLQASAHFLSDVVSTLLTYWVIFLFCSFAGSVLALTFVETQLIRREGWRVFRTRGLFDLYWRELPLLQRLLIKPGLIAFLLLASHGARSASNQSMQPTAPGSDFLCHSSAAVFVFLPAAARTGFVAANFWH